MWEKIAHGLMHAERIAHSFSRTRRVASHEHDVIARSLEVVHGLFGLGAKLVGEGYCSEDLFVLADQNNRLPSCVGRGGRG